MDATDCSLPCRFELSSVLDCIPHPAILLDTDLRIVASNLSYRSEFAGDEDVIGKHCYEVSHHYTTPCDQLGEVCPIHRAGDAGQPGRVLHVHYTPGGEEHQDVTAYPVTDRSGTIRGFVEIVRRPRIASIEPSRNRLVGRSPAFNRALELIQRVSMSDTTVLLLGESGTGKELAAEAVHRLSRRSHGPFVPVDCSGLNESLFESELFGHDKGAFTGAYVRKQGLVEAARQGTLFLDEVGDIPLTQQVKLLRLLETGKYRRVGSVDANRADFRLVCATHRDLVAMVETGDFRRDLYYRLSAFPVTLPPLRDRLEDLPLLVESLLERINGGRKYKIDADALAQLYTYEYPGNVRELLNILERACLLLDGDTILPEHLPDTCRAGNGGGRPVAAGDRILPLSQVESRYLQWAAARFDGDNATLARKLGVGERTLYRKLRRIRESGHRVTPHA